MRSTTTFLDRIIDGDDRDALLKGALAFSGEVIADGAKTPRVRDNDERLGDEATNAPIFEKVRALAHRKRRGQMGAPEID